MTLLLSIYLLVWRKTAGTTAFVILISGFSLWSLGCGFESSPTPFQSTTIGPFVNYAGMMIVATAYFAFTLRYTGKGKYLKFGIQLILTLIPLLTILLMGIQKGLDHLLPTLIRTQVIESFAYRIDPEFTHRFALAYASTLLTLGTLLLMRLLVLYRGRSRGQALMIIIGVIVPWIGNLPNTRWTPSSLPDMTLPAFAITITTITIALFHYQLLDIVPTHREKIPESNGRTNLQDPSAARRDIADFVPSPEDKYHILFEYTDEPIFLTTLDGKILDCNQATYTYFDYHEPELIGKSLNEILTLESPSSDVITKARRNGYTILEGTGKTKIKETSPIEIRTRVISTAGRQLILIHTRDITGSKKIERSLLESQQKSRAFYDISRSWVEIDNIPDLLQSVADSVAEALPADRATIITINPNKDQITHYIRGGENKDLIRYTSLQELNEGLTGWVMRTGKIALSPKDRPDVRESLKVQKRRANTHSGSVLVVPLTFRDRVLGTITAINSPDQPNFNRIDAELMQAIANQLAISIENTTLFNEANRRIQESETLLRTGPVVTATLQQDETIKRILEQLANVIPYDSASVQLLIDGYLEIVGGRGWEDPKAVIGIRFPVPAENPNTLVIQHRKAQIFGDVSATYSSFLTEPHSHINSWLGVPLIVNQQIIGMLALDSVQTNFFTENHARQATVFADQVAVAIQNARLYTTERQRVDELDALRATMADISAELELPILLETILERAISLLNASGGDLGIYDRANQKITITASRNMGKDFSGVQMVLGEGAMGKAAESLQPVIIEDYTHWIDKSPQYQSGPWQSVIAVPLLIGGRLVGAIGIVDSNPNRKFSTSDQRLLHLFGQQAAIAIQNAQLHAEVQRLAITDSLTGLYNRRGLFELGQRELERARRNNHPLAAVMLDIDHFKRINDTYSHAVGDQVLKILAKRCKANLRDLDILGRYGGEEFAILLPDTDQQEAQQIAERLRQNMNTKPVKTDKGQIELTISLGVAFANREIPDMAILLDWADTAMYRAKQAGRNRVEIQEVLCP